MSLPSILELQKVARLLSEVDLYSEKFEVLSVELEQVEGEVSRKSGEEYSREVDNAKRKISLEKMSLDVEKLQADEEELKKEIDKILDAKVEEFLSSGKYKEFVEDLVLKLKEEGKVEAIVGEDLKDFVPEGVAVVDGVKGELKFVLGVKTYVLSPKEVARELKDKLIKKLLPTE